MQTTNQNPEPSTVAASGVSPVRSALAYVALAFAFSWLLWVLVIKAHGREAFLYFGEAGPAVAAIALSIRRQRNLSSSRIQRVVWFISMLALCWIVLSLHYLGQAGAGLHFRPDPILILPAVLPAWVLSGACSSDAGVRALLRRLIHPPNRWCLFALLSFPAFQLIPAAVAYHFKGKLIWPGNGGTMLVQVMQALIFFAFTLLFTAVLEEPGWRGFLLDRLQVRFSPLLSTLLVWLPWSAWHGPLDYYRPVRFSLVVWLLLRVVTMIPLAIILTWIYNRSGRSIQATALFHASMNTCPYVLPYSQPGMALLFVWAAYAVVNGRMWRFDRKFTANYLIR
jgi:membrane protease YdiL (CAAX protease family)